MTLNEEQVEWIVAEVMRRLAVADGPIGLGSAAGGELVVADRVVTMRVIEGRLAGVSRLIVPKRSVVTPAVKDELRARNVELVVQKQ